jgi:hypothetical protein
MDLVVQITDDLRNGHDKIFSDLLWIVYNNIWYQKRNQILMVILYIVSINSSLVKQRKYKIQLTGAN